MRISEVIRTAADSQLTDTKGLLLGVVSAIAVVLAPVLTALVSTRGKKPHTGDDADDKEKNVVSESTVLDRIATAHTPDASYLNSPIQVLFLNKLLGDQAVKISELSFTVEQMNREKIDLLKRAEAGDRARALLAKAAEIAKGGSDE